MHSSIVAGHSPYDCATIRANLSFSESHWAAALTIRSEGAVQKGCGAIMNCLEDEALVEEMRPPHGTEQSPPSGTIKISECSSSIWFSPPHTSLVSECSTDDLR